MSAMSDHFLTSSLPHILTSSHPHILTSSLPHILTSSLPHFLMSSLPHFLTSSLPHFLTSLLPNFSSSEVMALRHEIADRHEIEQHDREAERRQIGRATAAPADAARGEQLERVDRPAED